MDKSEADTDGSKMHNNRFIQYTIDAGNYGVYYTAVNDGRLNALFEAHFGCKWA